MKLIVVGGQSRNVGKTSLVAGIIQATSELRWTALKITQYGHGICSTSTMACACSVEDPTCSYSIDPELNRDGRSDTSRFLCAGASEVYWVRTRVGQLGPAIPALRRMFEARDFLIVESNSILEFMRPDLYISVLQPGLADMKTSYLRYASQADAYVVTGSGGPSANGRPVFQVAPPHYLSAELLDFIKAKTKLG